MKTEELRVIISAHTGGYKKGAASALQYTKAFTADARRQLDAATATWTKHKAAVVREMEAATRGVKREQEKMRALKDRISNRSTMRADAIAAEGVREGWTDRTIAGEIKKEGLSGAVADSDRAASAYALAKERLAEYTKQARQAREALGGLDEKIKQSQGAAQAEKERARAAMQSVKAEAAATKERVKAAAGVRRFGLSAIGALLGARTLYAGLRRLATSMYSAMMANTELNKGLREIKGNLAIAFQGIFQAILPALKQLVSWLATATNWIAQFVGNLFGVSWSTATKGAKDTQKAVSGAGKAAKGAAASFDELNVLQEEGGGGGVETDSIFTDAKAFDFSWLDGIKGFFDDIKSKIPAETLQKFVDAFERLKEAWSKFKDSAFAKAVVDFVEDVIALSADIVITTLANAMDALADAMDAVRKAFDGDWDGAFESYIQAMEDIKRAITEPFEKIKEFLETKWYDKIFDALGVSPEAREKFYNFGELCADGLLNGLTGGLYGKVKSAIELFIAWIKEILGIHSPSTVFEGIGSFCAEGLVAGIKKGLLGVKEWIDKTFINPIKTAFDNTTTEISGFFTKLWDDTKNTFKTAGEWFKTNVTKPIGDFFKDAISNVVGLLNQLIGWLNQKLNVSWSAVKILGKEVIPAGSFQLFTIPSIPTFAQGGYPEDGLFMANRGELVGQFSNGRTAVANNEQIVAGIRAGVYDAVVAAMGEGRGETPLRVYLDGQEIYNNQQRVRANRGYPVGLNPNFGL